MKRLYLLILSWFLFLNLSCQIISIPDLQGTGKTSPYYGQMVTTEGAVTGDFQASSELKGFFIQDTVGDGNLATSDGIFVYDSLSSFNVNIGDYVKVTGEVDELFGLTLIRKVSSVQILGSGFIIAPTILRLPVPTIDSFERYESMLVQINQPLTIVENYNLGRYGELLLSAQGRMMTATNFIDPNDSPASGNSSSGASNVGEIDSLNEWYGRNRLVLNDGSLKQNPNPTPYVDPVTLTLRDGSTLDSLTGILTYNAGIFGIHPTTPPFFHYASRPASPPAPTGGVRIASFNVLNYFNGNGRGQGFPTARGASTLLEFTRQRSKIFEALKALNADLVGLMEIENDGDSSLSAIADLVNGLNTAIGVPGTYAAVPAPVGANGNPGSDAIKVAMIYKPAKVTPVGMSLADTSAVNSRNPLAQTFQVNAGGEVFSVIVNHFKSKNCGSATGADADQQDGQGCYNYKRKLQAGALLAFLEKVQLASGDPDVLIIGDLNSNEEEDPIDTLRAYGLVSLASQDYSYIFDGETGSLDHALCTPSFAGKIVSATVWHINADEPRLLDYNQEFNPAIFYHADPYRSSDHDPLLVTVDLASSSRSESGYQNDLFRISPNPGGLFKLEFREAGNKRVEVLDSTGKLLFFKKVNGNNATLDLTNYAGGEYWISVSGQKGHKQTNKVLVQ